MEIEEVVDTCAAFHMGQMAGSNGLSTHYNDFEVDTNEHYAWLLGYNVTMHRVLLEHEGLIN